MDNILGFLNMISHEEPEREYEPAICSSSYWLFTDVGGLLGTTLPWDLARPSALPLPQDAEGSGIADVRPEINTWVRKGQVIAVVKNIFGDVIKKYHAPEDGVHLPSCTPHSSVY